jgi:hypothetical protein
LSKSAKLKGEITTLVVQAASETGNAKGLAGCSANEEVDLSILVLRDGCEVAVQRHVGVVVFQHCARKRLNLAKKSRLPAQPVPCRGRGFDAAAH